MKNLKLPLLLFFGAFLFFFYSYERNEMFGEDYRIQRGPLNSSLAIFTMFIVSIIYCATTKAKVTYSKLARSFNVQMIELYLVTLFFAAFIPLNSRIQYFSIILPLLLFFFSYKLAIDLNNTVVTLIGYSIVAIALAVYFLNNYQNNIFYDIEHQNNSAYTVLMFLPFLLCYKNRIIRIASMFLFALIIMYSLKRGGFFALIFGLAMYFLIDQFLIKEKKNSFKGLIVFFLAAFGFYYLFEMFNETSGGLLANRLDDMADSQGSGRLDVYNEKLYEIVNSNPIGLIFGHGWRATELVGKSGYTAHNDILEITYDFGIVGLILFIRFLVSLFGLLKELIKSKSQLAAPLGASIGLLIINIMVAHIWIYSKYLSIFALFWGFALAMKDNEYFKHKTI